MTASSSAAKPLSSLGVLEEAGPYILYQLHRERTSSKNPKSSTAAPIQAGDTVIAVPSNGLHTNGYSLVRALMAQHPTLVDEQIVSAGRKI